MLRTATKCCKLRGTVEGGSGGLQPHRRSGESAAASLALKLPPLYKHMFCSSWFLYLSIRNRPLNPTLMMPFGQQVQQQAMKCGIPEVKLQLWMAAALESLNEYLVGFRV